MLCNFIRQIVVDKNPYFNKSCFGYIYSYQNETLLITVAANLLQRCGNLAPIVCSKLAAYKFCICNFFFIWHLVCCIFAAMFWYFCSIYVAYFWHIVNCKFVVHFYGTFLTLSKLQVCGTLLWHIIGTY